MSRSDPEDEEDEEEDSSEDEEGGLPPRPRRRRGHRTAAGLERWETRTKGPDEPAAEEEDVPARKPKRPVFFRARDSLYFEPLVALAIIVLLLVGLYAYTQNWPPVYVVESDSMQHGAADQLGLINTGDLVLSKSQPTDQIVTYVVGSQTGYRTYGEPGDVILYHANGLDTGAPVIHRALLYLTWSGAAYTAVGLSALSCGTGGVPSYTTSQVSGGPTGCGTTNLPPDGTITLYNIGWRSATVYIPLGTLGRSSGFITMGDNNNVVAGTGWDGETDQGDGLSGLVQSGWIVGVARGMIPWFGALKLVLEHNAQQVPIQSWEFMGITITAVILIAIGIHLALRAAGVEDERRRWKETTESTEDGEEPPERPSFWRGLRPWGRESDDKDEEDAEPVAPTRAKRSAKARRSPARASASGRPRPTVRRSAAVAHTKRRHVAPDPTEDE